MIMFFMKPTPRGETVFDIGMNDGSDTAYYLHKGFKVIGVEANPNMAEQCKTRFADEVKCGKLTIVNKAISDKSEDLEFWVCDSKPEWSSFDRKVASRNGSTHHAIKVDGIHYSHLVERYGVPNFVKIDIEGHDHVCVKQMQPSISPIYMSVELSDSTLEAMPFYIDLGYTYFKVISQRTLLPIQPIPTISENILSLMRGKTISSLLPNRSINALEALIARRDGTWLFDRGSSGPMSKDTPGIWLSAIDAEKTIRRNLMRMRNGDRSIFWNNNDYSFWFDIHMKKSRCP